MTKDDDEFQLYPCFNGLPSESLDDYTFEVEALVAGSKDDEKRLIGPRLVRRLGGVPGALARRELHMPDLAKPEGYKLILLFLEQKGYKKDALDKRLLANRRYEAVARRPGQTLQDFFATENMAYADAVKAGVGFDPDRRAYHVFIKSGLTDDQINHIYGFVYDPDVEGPSTALDPRKIQEGALRFYGKPWDVDRHRDSRASMGRYSRPLMGHAATTHRHQTSYPRSRAGNKGSYTQEPWEEETFPTEDGYESYDWDESFSTWQQYSAEELDDWEEEVDLETFLAGESDWIHRGVLDSDTLDSYVEEECSADKNLYEAYLGYKEARDTLNQVRRGRGFWPVIAIPSPDGRSATLAVRANDESFRVKGKDTSQEIQESTNLMGVTLTMPEGHAILDCGAALDCIGEAAAARTAQAITASGETRRPAVLDKIQRFKFGGDGDPVEASFAVTLPVQIGDAKTWIEAFVVPGSTPHLISQRWLSQHRCVVNFDPNNLCLESPEFGSVPHLVTCFCHLRVPQTWWISTLS